MAICLSICVAWVKGVDAAVTLNLLDMVRMRTSGLSNTSISFLVKRSEQSRPLGYKGSAGG
jgi:hypothetical protein